VALPWMPQRMAHKAENSRLGVVGVSTLSWACAIEMVRRGFWVFPLADWGKLPRKKDVELKLQDAQGRGGFYAKSRDLDVIGMWTERLPDANYAVVCGEKLGVTVVDLDRHGPGQDGVAVLKGWQGVRELGCNFWVRTPSDGIHLYYKGFPGKSRTIVSGVELQNWGRYVVGPGCHTRKGTYAGSGDFEELLPGPEWLVRAVGEVGSSSSGVGGKKSILTCVAEWGYVPEGFRHDAVFMEAVVMAGEGYGEEEAFVELRGLVDKFVIGGPEFPDREIRRNIQNAINGPVVRDSAAVWSPPGKDAF
jgi:bifunctional DNA primase/polymerase-like protein